MNNSTSTSTTRPPQPMNNSTTRPPQPIDLNLQTSQNVIIVPENDLKYLFSNSSLHMHSLKHLNNRKQEGYKDGFSCDFCGVEHSNSDFSYHCDQCPLDCCEDCYKIASNGKRNDR